MSTIRTRGRTAIPAAAIPVAALLAGAAAGCTYGPRLELHEEVSRLAVPLAPQARLVVENPRGSVHLTGREGGEIEVVAVKRVRGRDAAHAREIAEGVRVDLVRSGDAVRLQVRYPGGVGDDGKVTIVVFGAEVRRPTATVDLEIAVPRGAPVEVETRSGDLFAHELAGPLSIRTSSGDARIDEHGGDLVLDTRSGDLAADRIAGSLTVRASSGDVAFDAVEGALSFEASSGDLQGRRVAGEARATTGSGDLRLGVVGGGLRVTTTSGDVTVREVAGAVEVGTASGDVVLGTTAVPDRVAVSTSSGDVQLRLGDPLRGRLAVTTSSGEIRARVPMALESHGRGRLRGRLGPGSATVELHTSSGDVQVDHAGARAEARGAR